MRSGPITTVTAEERVDRRAEVLPLWERGKGAAIDMPWAEADSLDTVIMQRLLAGARTVAVVVGATEVSRTLLNAVLDHVAAPCRLYVYGDRALEPDVGLVRRLARMGDRALVRLGYRPPADWLVVDGGREGLLLLGPGSADRRWVVPIDQALSRSLFEVFRILFWFHAVREALPDIKGDVVFGTPLPAPFAAPDSDIPLPSGRLVLHGDQVDPVPDAEIRISPTLTDPGHARVLFVPPTDGFANGSPNGPMGLNLPKSLVSRGQRVLWVDTGLPRTTVTRQRMLVDLVEGPIALQLQWPQATAIEFLHRFERIAARPEWEFHSARRLSDVRDQVLLDGATKPDVIVPSVVLDAGDVAASLDAFDAARPNRLPDVPPLALQATFQWRCVPVSLPAGARPAEVVRQWTAVDEWASRNVDRLRAAIAEAEGQEGPLSRLLRWLPSRDAAVMARKKFGEEVDVIAESPPSQVAEQAKDHLERLVQIAGELDALRRSNHADRQEAEDAQAKEHQRTAWQARIGEAKSKLADARRRLAENEEALAGALNAETAAQASRDALVAQRREARLQSLQTERVDLDAEFDTAQAGKDVLDPSLNKKALKAARKKALSRIDRARQAVTQNQKRQDSNHSWSPPAAELGEVSTTLSDASRARAGLKSAGRDIAEEIKGLERSASEEFAFDAPPRLSSPRSSQVGSHPPVPSEAPPELGALFEHRGERFLAIRTWEQLRRAEPVATRLRATLVVSSPLRRGKQL